MLNAAPVRAQPDDLPLPLHVVAADRYRMPLIKGPYTIVTSRGCRPAAPASSM
jgi:hypothetical protein